MLRDEAWCLGTLGREIVFFELGFESMLDNGPQAASPRGFQFCSLVSRCHPTQPFLALLVGRVGQIGPAAVGDGVTSAAALMPKRRLSLHTAPRTRKFRTTRLALSKTTLFSTTTLQSINH